ncbi:MAG: carboxypeptidase regulatory-like domain-containing protein [Mucilaginibacter sp.]
MSLKKLSFTLLFLAALSSAVFAQTDTVSLNTIIKKTVKLSNERPFEKVYLHFDKPYYAIGDTVWFKTYVTIDTHQPSALSKVVYVDVISSKDSIVQTLKFQVTGGIALGDFILSDANYKQGNYRVRAYTNYMRNFDAAYFFNKTIPVGDFNKTINTTISIAGTTQNNNSKVSAIISYKDPTGRPFANKRVTWKVVNDDDNISKGKGTTNANGIIDVTFTTNKTEQINTSVLVTEIEVSDEKKIGSTFSLKHAVAPIDFQLFPEGGDLINSITSKVAFKAVGPNGLGVGAKGTVTDNTGVTVANLTSQHLGMGVFSITPESGKTYKANITFADGSQNSYPLPKAREEGITLSADNSNANNLIVKISANSGFLAKNNGKLFYIVAQNGETICFAAQTALSAGAYSSPIPKTKFPSGVLKLTLFTDRGEALAERIVLIQRNDLLNITMKSTQPVYTARDKVVMNVTANKDQKPVEANMSVTVVDETKVPYDEIAETTILTNLLLTSEIKGYIEKPNYYFTNVNEKTIADADVLMLTQGYRRFNYKDILANIYPQVKFQPESGITVSGTLRNSTGLPISKGNLTLQIPDRKISLNTVANVAGEFKFSNLVIPDSTKVIISAKNNPSGYGFMIMPDGEIFQPVTANINAPDGIVNIDSTLNPYLNNAKQRFAGSRVLKEVVINAAPVVKKQTHIDHPALSGLSTIADHVITAAQLTSCPYLYQCLQTTAAGITFDNNNIYVNRSYTQGDKRPMQIYLDGLNVDINALQSVNTSDVESVEVFFNDGLSNINRMTGTNGVLVINTKIIPKIKYSKAEIMALLMPKNNEISIFPRGYSESRAFYAPKYEVTKVSAIGGDLRTTILWNPNVITDKTGAATFQFFNADGKGTYRAIIEGIDSDGNIGRYVYRYKVQ